MKMKLTLFLLGLYSASVLASGQHVGGDAPASHQHGMSGMSGMSHEEHDDEAGRAGDPANINRNVDVTMADTMRFTPNRLTFKAGDTVRFKLRNDGKIRHEMVIGTMAELREHAAMMRANPTMRHEEPNMISLAPGAQGEIIWQFDKVGQFDFACLVPGHLEAGMLGKIKVN